MFLPDMDSLEVIELLHLSRPAGKITAMSGGSTEHDNLYTAKRLEADHTLKKQFSLLDLLKTVSSQWTEHTLQ